MKKYIWYLYAFLASIILYLIIGYYIYNKNIRFRTEFIAKSRYGRIESIGKNSRKSTRFTLQNQKEVNGIYLERNHGGINDTVYNLYQIAEIGDSIFKESNSACLKLIKKNGEEIWFQMVEH